ncbi:MAG: hypothetical protein WDN72_10130 [Alphaproteobacteria bacterium]
MDWDKLRSFYSVALSISLTKAGETLGLKPVGGEPADLRAGGKSSASRCSTATRAG